MYPTEISYAYTDPWSRAYNSIDFFLCSENISSCVSNSDIKCAPSPDHKSVEITVLVLNKVRGNGYWKMNTGVLKYKEYIKRMETLLL